MNDRLYRTRQHRILGGVAAGLGDYLNIDPVIIRILFVVLTIINGLGILLYIIFWVIVPENEAEQPEVYASSTSSPTVNFESQDERNKPIAKKNNSGNGKIVAGLILIILGFSFLSERFFPFFDFEDFFPLLLLILGVGLIWSSIKNNRKENEKE